MKHPEWRQPTPAMQLHSIVMLLDGEVMLIEDTIAEGNTRPNMRVVTPRLRVAVEMLRQLLPYIDGKEQW